MARISGETADEAARVFDEVIDQHLNTLARQRLQLATPDPYGVVQMRPWLIHLGRFIETVLGPKLARIKGSTPIIEKTINRKLKTLDTKIKNRAMQIAKRSSLDDVETGHQYEHHCASLLRSVGWKATVTKGSGDQGVDILGEFRGRRAAFQCKFYSKPVGNKAVQEASAARLHTGSDIAIVIASSGFTPAARQLAATTRTILIHHDELSTLHDLIGQR